jgi:tetratricopeptide (TPR) repeat protein
MSARRPAGSLNSIQRLLTHAVDAHKAGELSAAKQLYLEILSIDVKHAKSLYGLGLIAHQAGNLDVAAKMIERAISVDPGEHAYLRGLGAVLKEQQKLDEALALYRAVLRLAPADEQAHFNSAEILREQGKLADAEVSYRCALKVNPDSSATYQNLGIVLRRQNRLEEAARCFARALELDPRNAGALHNAGNVLLDGGHAAGAKAAFTGAVELAPELAEAHNGLGAALQELGELEAAEAAYREAIRLNPGYAEAHCNLGNLGRRRGELEKATEHYERALALKPNLAEAHSNLGLIMQNRGKLGEARLRFDRAIALDPGSADSRWNLCLLDLLEGNLEAGWKAYEIRYARRQSAPRAVPGPLWRGEPLEGKHIFLHSEQGLGDTLQFLRYVPRVTAAGGTVILDVQAPVRPLAAEIPGIVLRAGDEEELPPFEWQCPLMGLPHAFRTTLATIPCDAPYLAVPQAAMDAAGRLDWPAGGLRVGLVWSGNPEHREDRYRSIALAELEPLLNLEGVHFFSLQLGARALKHSGGGLMIRDLEGAIKDLADTAALMMHLDLVITVDTAVAHLAGALARPVWMLLPFAPDWRWLTEREDSPWYPTMRLFRAGETLRWEPVVEGLRKELDMLVRAQPGC